jgi:hypothetical protein
MTRKQINAMRDRIDREYLRVLKHQARIEYADVQYTKLSDIVTALADVQIQLTRLAADFGDDNVTRYQ